MHTLQVPHAYETYKVEGANTNTPDAYTYKLPIANIVLLYVELFHVEEECPGPQSNGSREFGGYQDAFRGTLPFWKAKLIYQI